MPLSQRYRCQKIVLFGSTLTRLAFLHFLRILCPSGHCFPVEIWYFDHQANGYSWGRVNVCLEKHELLLPRALIFFHGDTKNEHFWLGLSLLTNLHRMNHMINFFLCVCVCKYIFCIKVIELI